MMPGIAAPQIAAPTDFQTKAETRGDSSIRVDSGEILKLAFWLAIDLFPSLNENRVLSIYFGRNLVKLNANKEN